MLVNISSPMVCIQIFANYGPNLPHFFLLKLAVDMTKKKVNNSASEAKLTNKREKIKISIV